MPEYLELNRANWDDRVPAHVVSADYAMQRFLDDPAFLSDVVRFDLPLLGDVSGLNAVHLQCHIGTDTISLARLGASMTGLDFSGPAVAEAARLAAAVGADASFVQADVYDAADILKPGSFDLVYTGVGALTWLPDIRRWGRVVADLLRPGGRLFIRDGHPMLLALDVDDDGRLVVTDPYFETTEARVSDYADTYVRTDVAIEHTVTHWWNHGLGETVTALLEAGLTLTGLAEHDTVPWRAFSGETMASAGGGEWRLTQRPERLAASFTLQAVKDS
ncbi:MAG TPA: class I SAM-dependent methyltransferase [Streptosporangiaceae bacterium]|nr:class I SAM-dependent methyltransferase [Streptosporangiaceae bacterium]